MSVAENDTSEVGFLERMNRMKNIQLPRYVKDKLISEGKEIPLKSSFLHAILISLIITTLFSSLFSATVSSQNNMSLMYQESSTNNLDEHTVNLRSEIVGFANEDYALYPRGGLDSCAPNKSILTPEQCFEAGESLGLEKMFNLTVKDVVVGEWVHTPRGCFSNLGDLHFSYFTGTDLDTETEFWKNYATICSVKDVDASSLISSFADYKIGEYGSLDQCAEGLLLTTAEACFEAAKSLRVVNFLSLQKEDIIVGNWSHTPRGCFLNKRGGKVLFSTFSDEITINKSTQFWEDYASICRNEDSASRSE
mmetsp:Transcript_63/g.86  ORF Transcript_63/g.86 Transcript_63/m.86 type:complete len:308 (-) Transcript_63:213-1136(-)